jgi:hypothetical protein
MRHIWLPLLSAVLFVLPVARAADDDVKAIIQKAIKAHGGEKALTKYKATRSKSSGKLVIPGAGEVEFTQEVTLMQPDKFKEAMELDIAGMKIKVVTMASGDKFSIEAAGKDVPITADIKTAMKEARYSMKMSRLTTLLGDKAVELSNLGEIKVEGKPAVGVRVASKGQKDLSLYFDKKTGLLAKVERRGTDPMTGNEFTEERIVLEYKEPNKEGISMPKKVTVKRDGKKFMEAEVSETTLLEKIDDSEFEK